MRIEALYDIYLQHPNITTDTRKIKEGDIFFALKGPSFNGNTFAEKAIQLGASYAVVDEQDYKDLQGAIYVNDSLECLQQLALYHRKQFNIPFIAITGSNGKTTTKELMHAVLSKQYKCNTTEGNLNNHIGIPLTILKTRSDAEMAIVEMGANHLNEIEAYCRYTLPTHGLITNLGKAHLDGFGSVEGVRKGKGELLDYLRLNKGTVFINTDDPYLLSMAEGIREIVTYGSGKDSSLRGQALTNNGMLSFEVFDEPGLEKVNTQLVGDYNLLNALAAVCTGKYFSVPVHDIQAAIEDYTPNNSRSQLIERNGYKIIMDAYNANPSSMTAAIVNFASIDHPYKILILGGMKELGADTFKEHQHIADLVAKYQWQEVILAGEEFSAVRTGLKKVADSAEAKSVLQQIPLNNAMILIKGSRGMQMEKLLEGV